MKYLNNLCSLVTDDAKYTCEIKRGIVMAKADCHGKSSHQQEVGSLHQKIGITCKEETSKVLHLEYSFVWC